LDAQFDKAMNESERNTQEDRKQLNDAFDKAMNDSDAQAGKETQDLNSQFDKAYNNSALDSANAEQVKKVKSNATKPGPGDTSQGPALPQKRAALQIKLNALNSRCGSVEQGSVAAASCKADQTKLLSEIASLQ
jgi:hypothetical protein